MGLFDKLKNVFFEEEEVDLDDKEETRKIPVAKKIDVSEPKKEVEHAEEKHEESTNKLEFDRNDNKLEPEKDFKFPMGFDDKDFEVEKTIEIFGPIKEKEEPEPEVREEVVSDEPPMAEPVVEEEYSYEESYQEPEPEVRVEETRESYHKLYEGREKAEEKSKFTPSPIISPIFGVLNQNYKKEEIVTREEKKKAEVVIKKDSVDMVLEKAYGDLAGEISASIDDDVIDINEDNKKEEKEDLLYDLNEEESPTVKTVTVGDAEEYFNDLGLEYNVDYKKEKEEEKKEEPVRSKRVEKLDIDDTNKEDDKNLFDLIDAMYEDEDKE